MVLLRSPVSGMAAARPVIRASSSEVLVLARVTQLRASSGPAGVSASRTGGPHWGSPYFGTPPRVHCCGTRPLLLRRVLYAQTTLVPCSLERRITKQDATSVGHADVCVLLRNSTGHTPGGDRRPVDKQVCFLARTRSAGHCACGLRSDSPELNNSKSVLIDRVEQGQLA